MTHYGIEHKWSKLLALCWEIFCKTELQWDLGENNVDPSVFDEKDGESRFASIVQDLRDKYPTKYPGIEDQTRLRSEEDMLGVRETRSG
ncbi:hypothetical protein BDV29DRAFT_181993 [Aspergillus leporis]|jgi:hypothetical protein|uniref:Uncharacterized protein n=1 Tax=Aspergillus leporis TaxID=41062 RepID=A0A5N5WMV6_9EURO|nr:hypothetical protein BDV29DRAFT_181993 [Aspergillus leporis]